MSDPVPTLTEQQLDTFGREVDAIRERVAGELGERDLECIRRLIRVQRGLEVTGRGLLFASFIPPAWLAGVAALSASKILDNVPQRGQEDLPPRPARPAPWDRAGQVAGRARRARDARLP